MGNVVLFIGTTWAFWTILVHWGWPKILPKTRTNLWLVAATHIIISALIIYFVNQGANELYEATHDGVGSALYGAYPLLSTAIAILITFFTSIHRIWFSPAWRSGQSRGSKIDLT